MFGQAKFQEENSLINQRLEQIGTLIVVHRGTPNMSIAENTSDAVKAALASGGDMVEIDVSKSTDGDFFAFHDGEEQRLLGINKSILEMSTAEIQAAKYIWVSRPKKTVKVEPLLDLLEPFKGATLFNIDRGWKHFATLLPQLAKLNMTQQLLIKAPAKETAAIAAVRACEVKFPFMPLCFTFAEAEEYLKNADPELNTVGVEIIAQDSSSSFTKLETLRNFKTQGLLICLNAEVLNIDIDLWCGYDDEVSILQDPELGWGKMFDFEPDAIITDWPWALKAYRDKRLAKKL